MLGKLFLVILYFLLATQPASKSLSTDFYYRLTEQEQPVLITLVDTAAAELTNSVLQHLTTDKEFNNFTDSEQEHDVHPVRLEILNDTTNTTAEVIQPKIANESQDNIKAEYTVKAVPREKEDSSGENLKTEIKTQNFTDNDTETIEKENATAPETNVSSKEDATKSSEVQEEIPSFAEWAQKQLEEAEKNGVNHSSKSTQGTAIPNVNLKVRSKNYASPDCGAKIVASNPEAGSAGFILSPSRDEYMLNTCNSRIWFIVELCEAIQAKKVDLANFELFSSTPKNFSVYVSDRFPTREWASVGQFIAKDERDIQTFNLHPHLFGKFIKVELHSYYGSEHYCPISLFRVYGTSEFEVFETENSPNPQSIQVTDDDDILEDVSDAEKQDLSRNLFGSARDAVISIVKKAAQVLVKGSDSNNNTESLQVAQPSSQKCKTPSHIIVCDNCSNSLFADVYNLMSCQGDILNSLIETTFVRETLCNTNVCQQFGLDFKSMRTLSVRAEIATYISALLLPSYMAALCNVLAIIEKKVVLNTSYETDLNITSNLTIDKKIQNAIDDGKLSDLLQKPFKTCSEETDPLCKEKPEKDNKPEPPPPRVPPDVIGGIIPDIKPTKTFHKEDITESTSTTTLPTEKTVEQKDNIQNEINTENSKASTTLVENDNSASKDGSENVQVDGSPKPVIPETINQTEKQDVPSISIQQGGDEIEQSNISTDSVEDNNIKLSTQDQISLDNLLKELEQASSDSATPAPQNTATTSHQGQKESVFLRLSNRIKALERNMSLSGQYLEELSRRYKKQMEEMQKTFEKTLLTISEESKKAAERDEKHNEEMLALQQQVTQLSTAVSSLIMERDSWFGNMSFIKFLFYQTFITVIVIYLLKRFSSDTQVSVAEAHLTNEGKQDKIKVRRKSAEEFLNKSQSKSPIRQRRPSEEAMNITRTATDLRESTLKVEKKKRKRKSPTVRRSLSIAAPCEPGLASIQSIQPDTPDDVWTRPDIQNSINDTPIALDEAEYLVPELESLDFNRIGEMNVPNLNGVTLKKEFPKTNGSIFGKKTPESDKTGKVRRLSSPAFLKAALNRSSSRNETSPPMKRAVSPVMEVTPRRVATTERQVKSEERSIRAGNESPQLSTWSSIGDVSDAGSSSQTDSRSSKKSKSKRSLKNIFKKVF